MFLEYIKPRRPHEVCCVNSLAEVITWQQNGSKSNLQPLR